MADSNKIPRVFIWCWPRTVSTALGKCLSNVDEVQFWNEPYQNCYNNEMHAKTLSESQGQQPTDPMVMEYMIKLQQAMATSNTNEFFIGSKSYPQDKFVYPWVKEKLEEDEPGKKFIIIKELSMAIAGKEQYLPEVPMRHLFLIRHPLRIAKSMAVAVTNSAKLFGQEDVDFEKLRNSPIVNQGPFKRDDSHALWRYIREKYGVSPDIFDSDDLCREPERMLPKIFKAMGISYDEKYLTWDADEEIVKSWKGSIGGIVTAKATKFYDRALQSSCFLPPKPELPKLDDIPKLFRENYDNLLKSYQEMYEQRVRPDN